MEAVLLIQEFITFNSVPLNSKYLRFNYFLCAVVCMTLNLNS